MRTIHLPFKIAPVGYLSVGSGMAVMVCMSLLQLDVLSTPFRTTEGVKLASQVVL